MPGCRMYKERDVHWKWCLQQATDHAKRALAVYHEEKPRMSKITLMFNRARTLEENRYFTQAASIYKARALSTWATQRGRAV